MHVRPSSSLSILLLAAASVLSACAPQQPAMPKMVPYAVKPLKDQGAEMMVDCDGYFAAYASFLNNRRYPTEELTRSYHTEAVKYYSIAHSDTLTDLALIAVDNGAPIDGTHVMAAEPAFQQREIKWSQWLTTATAEQMTGQMVLCTAYLPSMQATTASYRKQPYLTSLYQRMDEKLQQRTSGHEPR